MSAVPQGPIGREFLTKNRGWGLWHTAWPIALLLAALGWAATVDTVAGGVAAVLAVGLLQYKCYFPLHEASHYTLLPTEGESRVAGHLLASLLVTPFDGFRAEHANHHRRYGMPDDPGAVDYFVRLDSRFALVRFLLFPLVGGAIVLKVLDNWAPLLDRARDLRRRRTGGKEGAGRETRQGRRAGVGIAWIAGVQLALAAIVTAGFAEFWRYPVFVLLPGATIFLFLSRLRMFLEHTSLDYDALDLVASPRPLARSVPTRFPEAFFLSGLAFNYHWEHHRYPAVSGRLLPRVHREITADALAPEEWSTSYAAALATLWRHLAGRERAA